MSFKNLELSEAVMKALAAEGYTHPTPIQAKAIPPILAGRDLQGCAQTGTGKTAAFAIPIIQHLQQDRNQKSGIKVLVLTPTRELAIQIDESFAAYGRYANISHTIVYGGVSQVPQVRALKQSPSILVATPGRLLDLIEQGHISLRQLEVFVLDEADRMLDMGFIHDVRRIIKLLPEKRQTLFFSATMPPEIQKLASAILKNPTKVEITPPTSTVDKIDQQLYHTNKADKPKLLMDLLDSQNIRTALVFTRTKHGANRLVKTLDKAQISAAAIHGNKSQTARQKALGEFKAGKLRVLVATDIAARGIDIDELTHVFNYDLPEVPETYIHRIGRTARAGLSGTAVAFCDIDEQSLLRDIEKLIGKRIPVVNDHAYPTDPFAQPKKASAPPARQNWGSRNRRVA